MNPTQGVLGEAWGLYKAHWRHLLTISFVVYLAVAVVNLLLGLFWVQGALTRAVDDIRDGRADLSFQETFDRVRPQLGSIVVGGLLAGLGIGLGLLLFIVPGLVLLTW